MGEGAVEEAGGAASGAASEASAQGEDETAGDSAAEEEEPARDLVLSGWVGPADKLSGKPAILDVPSGRGRVVLFAFDPLHRYLNLADFRFLYNALLNWNDLP